MSGKESRSPPPRHGIWPRNIASEYRHVIQANARQLKTITLHRWTHPRRKDWAHRFLCGLTLPYSTGAVPEEATANTQTERNTRPNVAANIRPAERTGALRAGCRSAHRPLPAGPDRLQTQRPQISTADPRHHPHHRLRHLRPAHHRRCRIHPLRLPLRRMAHRLDRAHGGVALPHRRARR